MHALKIITLLFAVLLHVSASTYGHHQAFVHYMKHRCTYICLLCEFAITNLNSILCHLVKIVKSIKLWSNAKKIRMSTKKGK
jgi:uncharacterized membrane protein YcfT